MRDPFLHSRFGEGAEVEQVGAMVEGTSLAQGPATGQCGISSASVSTVLQGGQYARHRQADDRDLRAGQAELLGG